MSSSSLILPGTPEFQRKPSGICIIDGQEVAHTLQCAHCGKHWIPVKGSGKQRGFCMRCMGATCGSKECMVCIPFEKKLRVMEKNAS